MPVFIATVGTFRYADRMAMNKKILKTASNCSRLLTGVVLSTLLLNLLSGCAHNQISSDSNTPLVNDPNAPISSVHEVQSFRANEPEGPKVVVEELEQIPTEINPLVEKWINYFQGRGRPHMERYLSRSARYTKLMKKIIRENGLPEDLIYIALIESGFSSKAMSRAAAVGYWQFIKPTGKRFGLEINALIDERRDYVLSTQAAAEYFKGLYSMFGSWYLAMASYNVGENRVKKEVMRHYTRDFWELARKKRFPKETINYIPKFIAAKLIGNDPAKYGFTDIDYMSPLEFELITVNKPVNLRQMAERMEMEYDDLKQLNPKFKGEIAPLKNQTLELRVPINTKEKGLIAAQQSSVDKIEYVADAGETEIYKVRKGDSLNTIAKKYRTNVAWLRDANDLKKGKKLKVGQRIAVPDRSGKKPVVVKYVAKTNKPVPVQPIAVATPEVAVAPTSAAEAPTVPSNVTASTPDNSSANPSVAGTQASVVTPEETEAVKNTEIVTSKGVFYVVQPGDTLSEIADDYNSSVEELRKMNKLSRASKLKAGMKLKVPKDEGLPADPGASNTNMVVEQKTPQTADREPQSRQIAESKVATAPVAANSDHVVSPGENLTTIAHRYGVSIQAIRSANNLSKKSVLRVGSRLVIPVNNRSNSAKPQTLIPERKSVKIARRPRIHIVRRGENLVEIAEKYNIPIGRLQEENRIRRGSKLLIGTQLLIPTAQAAY